jgi:hypothetical protein
VRDSIPGFCASKKPLVSGWKFSILELQALLVKLICDFEFTVPIDGNVKEVYRSPSPIMSPTVEGERSSKLLLNVTVIAD